MFTVQALQYKTDQVADVKKIEKLNLLFFALMGQGSDAESEPSLLFRQLPASNCCMPQPKSSGTYSWCLQFQWMNLWTPLQLPKYKSRVRKCTQINSPERGRKGEKADKSSCI